MQDLSSAPALHSNCLPPLLSKPAHTFATPQSQAVQDAPSLTYAWSWHLTCASSGRWSTRNLFSTACTRAGTERGAQSASLLEQTYRTRHRDLHQPSSKTTMQQGCCVCCAGGPGSRGGPMARVSPRAARACRPAAGRASAACTARQHPAAASGPSECRPCISHAHSKAERWGTSSIGKTVQHSRDSATCCVPAPSLREAAPQVTATAPHFCSIFHQPLTGSAPPHRPAACRS